MSISEPQTSPREKGVEKVKENAKQGNEKENQKARESGGAKLALAAPHIRAPENVVERGSPTTNLVLSPEEEMKLRGLLKGILSPSFLQPPSYHTRGASIVPNTEQQLAHDRRIAELLANQMFLQELYRNPAAFEGRQVLRPHSYGYNQNPVPTVLPPGANLVPRAASASRPDVVGSANESEKEESPKREAGRARTESETKAEAQLQSWREGWSVLSASDQSQLREAAKAREAKLIREHRQRREEERRQRRKRGEIDDLDDSDGLAIEMLDISSRNREDVEEPGGNGP